MASDAAEPDAAVTCPTFSEPTQIGTLQSAMLDEISGLVASRALTDTFWAHEDSGAGAVIYALTPAGEIVAAVALNDADADDWEDMSLGPVSGEDGDFIFVADIGDNLMERDNVVIYRVREPATLEASFAADTFATTLTYPDGAHNAEAFFVDPRNGDAYIVSKDMAGRNVHLYKWPASPLSTTAANLEDLGRIPVGGQFAQIGRVITAADMCPDGRTVLLRAYAAVWAYALDADAVVADVLAGTPCGLRGPTEGQGETIACGTDNHSFTTVSEGAGSALWSVAW